VTRYGRTRNAKRILAEKYEDKKQSERHIKRKESSEIDRLGLLSFFHTNSCTFHTTMYHSFKLY